jgi:hypothetical protein
MFRIIFGTFFGTGFTGIGAYPAELVAVFAAEAHHFRRGPADGGAFQVQPDAQAHHFNIIFP